MIGSFLKTQLKKWLPLIVLTFLAMVFEPIRSGFQLESQACEWKTELATLKLALLNFRHVISFGILTLVAAATFKQNQTITVAIAVFMFSAFLEFEQSFFSSGHCRLWDLIPNICGIGIAAILIIVVRKLSSNTPARSSN